MLASNTSIVLQPAEKSWPADFCSPWAGNGRTTSAVAYLWAPIARTARPASSRLDMNPLHQHNANKIPMKTTYRSNTRKTNPKHSEWSVVYSEWSNTLLTDSGPVCVPLNPAWSASFFIRNNVFLSQIPPSKRGLYQSTVNMSLSGLTIAIFKFT